MIDTCGCGRCCAASDIGEHITSCCAVDLKNSNTRPLYLDTVPLEIDLFLADIKAIFHEGQIATVLLLAAKFNTNYADIELCPL